MVQIGGASIPLRSVRARHRKICPRCVADQVEEHASFELVGVKACAVHKLKLQDRCSDCRDEIIWGRGTRRHCSCGFPLARLAAVRADRWEVIEATLYRDALVNSYAGADFEELVETGLAGYPVVSSVLLLGWIFEAVLPALPAFGKVGAVDVAVFGKVVRRLAVESLADYRYCRRLMADLFCYAWSPLRDHIHEPAAQLPRKLHVERLAYWFRSLELPPAVLRYLEVMRDGEGQVHRALALRDLLDVELHDLQSCWWQKLAPGFSPTRGHS